MYIEYKLLETLIRRCAAPSSSRGQGFATIAKEQLFSLVYKKLDSLRGT